jgi:long-subunit fatty acid transport protein
MLGVFAGLAVLALAASAFGDADWNLTGQGARALGMGGAFIGICDDATALSWNPAGLAQLDRPELSGVFKLETHKNYYSPKSYTYDGTTYDLSSSTRSNTHFVVNFISGAFPLKVAQRNLTFAVAYQQQLDSYFSSGDSTYKDEQTGGAYTISPGLAYQIMPQLALGAAVNIWTGSANEHYVTKPTATLDYTRKTPYSGLNFLFGAHAKFKPVRLGVILRTPATLKYHYDYSGTMPTGWLSRLPVSGENKQKLPMMFGFGMAVDPTQNFTISADVDIRPYSNMEVLDSADVKDTTEHFPSNTQIRLGAEYLLMLHQAIVPLRVGFRTDPKTYFGWVVKTDTVGGLIYRKYVHDDKGVTGVAFTFGTGVAVKHFELDGAFEFAHSKVPYVYDSYYTSVHNMSPSTLNWNASYIRWLMSAIFKF